MYTNDFKEITKLQPFANKEEFNIHFRNAMSFYKKEFTKFEYIALKHIKNFACKYAGLVFAKVETLISALSEKSEDAPSRSTFMRAIRKAKKLGILEAVPLKQARHKNLKGNNVLVFGKCEKSYCEEHLTQREAEKLTQRQEPKNLDIPRDEPIKNDSYTSNFSYTSDIKTLRRDNVLSSEFVSNKIPKKLVALISTHYDNYQVITDCFNITKNIFRKYEKENYEFATDIELQNEKMEEAARALYSKTNKEKYLSKPVGYFVRTIQKMVDQLAFEERNAIYNDDIYNTEKAYIDPLGIGGAMY